MMLSIFLIIAFNTFVSGTLFPKKEIVIKAKSLGRHREHGLSYANFKAHKNSKLKLDTSKVKAVMVHNIKECGIACVKNYFCVSFNIAIRSDVNGHFVCETLVNDKYNEPSKFVASRDFHHYSIMTPCLKSPCDNSGRCIPRYQDDMYRCSCVAGYTGNHCQIEIDECKSSPCQNGGTCIDAVNGFKCNCRAGFQGVKCEINIDECKSSPCQNGGTCIDAVNGFKCNCRAGFQGVKCEINIDECKSSPCQNGGTCIDAVNGFKCNCRTGFQGVNCEINIDECKSGPCQNGGICIDAVNGFKCNCRAGFQGVNCEINIDECKSSPCHNGGTCIDAVNGFKCNCRAGFQGMNCEINIDECKSSPCQNGGTCIDAVHGFKCNCRAGFQGVNCEINIDECKSSPCQNGGTCIDAVNGFKCNCRAGFQGVNCEIIVSLTFGTKHNSGRYGPIQQYVVSMSGVYKIRAGGAKGGTHSYNYGTTPGTYFGGKGATMEGKIYLAAGIILKIVVGQRGGDSVEVKGGQSTTLTAAQLGFSVEDNAGTGGGGGTFVYTSNNTLLIAAGGGGGASAGYNGVDGQAGPNGTRSRSQTYAETRAGGVGGQPGQCNSRGASYHGGVGAGWLAQGCARAGTPHGERGGSRSQSWVGGRTGGMNSGYKGGPPPGAVGGFGGGGGGSEDNGASGGGGGYSGGGSGTHPRQAGGGGGSYCKASAALCSGHTGGNTDDNGFVQISTVLS